MDSKQITFITNLPIWSISNGVGAPSMYLTLQAYSNDGWKIDYLSTEPHVDGSSYRFNKIICLDHFNLLGSRRQKFRKILKYPNWLVLNFITLLILFYRRPKGVIYAYEIYFVPAARIYTLFNRSTKFVSRFQGTILTPILRNPKGRNLRMVLQKLDHFVGLSLRSDLILMTDDGTKGDQVLQFLGNRSNLLFLKNGVGWPSHIKPPESNYDNYYLDELFASAKAIEEKVLFFTCCRLNRWKRVDRSIEIFKGIHDRYPDSHLYVIGDGPELRNLKNLVHSMQKNDCISFLGAVPQHAMPRIQERMNFFISTYELSNVGNPLWEAIRAGCAIVTLSNGDTQKYIKDCFNGFIRPEDRFMENVSGVLKFLRGELSLVERPRLPLDVVSWEQRLKVELEAVANL